MAWVRSSCATGMYHSIGHVELMNFKLEFLLNGIKHPRTLLSHPQHQHSVHPGINATCNENVVNKNRQKAILTGCGRPIFLGEGVAAHLGHQAFRVPLHDIASHVRVKQLLNLPLYPFGRVS